MDLVILLLIGFIVGPYNLRMGLRMYRDPESYHQMAASSPHPLAPYWALPKAIPWIRRASFIVIILDVIMIGLGVFGVVAIILGGLSRT